MSYKHIKYLNNRCFLLIVFLILFICSGAQQKISFIWPIDSPFVITGNYGELRPNHFHAGVDFSTSGKINLPVYAIEEGYVSRIRVSPYGYGKCVYITHPNGKVSVYAHLNNFSLKVANLAKENQYITQSYEIDFMLRPRTTYVRKNEIIGLSGNSGGSTGPHLHFEIRDELSEIPLNPLQFYKIADRTSPEILALAFYNLCDTSAPKFISAKRVKKSRGDSLIMDNDHLVLNQSIIGLAYEGMDRVYPDGNANNIFAAKIYLDDKLVYEHQLSTISFDESRFINEFSDKVGKSKFQKCFLPTLYPSDFFGNCFNKGRLLLSDTVFHKVKLIVTDESGNSSPLQFYLKAKQINNYSLAEEKKNIYVDCSTNYTGSENDVYINIPEKSLFYSKSLTITNTINENGKLSIFPDLNLKQAVTVGFKVPVKFLSCKEKLVLNGSSNALPVIRDDSVYYKLKTFGRFYLSCDTLAPKIKINYSERQLKEAWKMDAFSFSITDNGSGIAKYNLWLNNSWVLSEYDAKQDLLTYYFDDETPIGILNFKLEVLDKVGNRSFLEYVLKK